MVHHVSTFYPCTIAPRTFADEYEDWSDARIDTISTDRRGDTQFTALACSQTSRHLAVGVAARPERAIAVILALSLRLNNTTQQYTCYVVRWSGHYYACLTNATRVDDGCYYSEDGSLDLYLRVGFRKHCLFDLTPNSHACFEPRRQLKAIWLRGRVFTNGFSRLTLMLPLQESSWLD